MSRHQPGTLTRQHQPREVPFRVVAAAVAGNALEFFDFITYAFFAVYIGHAFFPNEHAIVSLLAALAVFGVGFVTRPLGGLLIGAYADRAGRRPAMLLTISLITVATLALALTPSYARIGMAAPIIIVTARLLQGLALGGEMGPATSYLIEVAPEGKRGVYGSWQLITQGGAALAAGIVGVILTLSLTEAQMQAWGWRVPFFIGLLLIPVGLYLREHMPESLHAPHRDADAKQEPTPVTSDPKAQQSAWRGHLGLFGLSIILVAAGAISNYVGIYMTTYAITTLKMSAAVSMSATIIFGLATMVGAWLGGWLSDRYGRRPVMVWSRIALLLAVYPAFVYLLDHTSFATLAMTTATLAGLAAISSAPQLIAIPELFPGHLRALGLSLSYALGAAAFGGTAQFVVAWAVDATGLRTVPAWYVIISTLIMLWAIWKIPETGKHKPLQA